jgi:NAD(P)-dependent dehydrogenase (short-subunit alcohol dehydrogenase family)
MDDSIIMFNNAGLVGATGPIEEVSTADWDRTISVLLRAVFLGIKYALPRSPSLKESLEQELT